MSGSLSGLRRRGPRLTCEVCGRDLVGHERYRVSLYWKTGPLKWTLYKDIVVCTDCLERVRRDGRIRQYFYVRVKKMNVVPITQRRIRRLMDRARRAGRGGL